MERIIEMITWVNFGIILTWASVIASIVGGIYTIIVYFRVSDIEKKYLVKVRLPDLIAQLQEKNKLLPQLLSNFEKDSEDREKKSSVSSSFHEVKVLLEDTIRKLELSRSSIKHIKDPITKWLNSVSNKKIKTMLRHRSLDIDGLWSLYSELSGIITRLEQMNTDLGWTRT
ncbi:hypothetical protein SOV88_19610 [Pectobacterium brasiliense]|uniref:hypothetical protein n=1 Tax=Pectobacterium brasiliense TaxID=180957 RepID=UPI002A802A91|nr:hypothetical protein [Pectobacterium brasiliense]MDY4326469.1 hypothetical protein [Pectobacterium brasiliense]